MSTSINRKALLTQYVKRQIKPIGKPSKRDLEYSKILATARESIADVFGIPPEMVRIEKYD